MSIEDRAQEHEAQIWAFNNINRKRLADPCRPGDPGYGPEHCEECGDDMPALRRSYGFKLCKACAESRERLRR